MSPHPSISDLLLKHSDLLDQDTLKAVRPLVTDLSSLLTAHSDNGFSGLPGSNKSEILQLILDNIPARVFWKDINSAFVGCNQVFASDHGFESPDSLRGKTDDDLCSTGKEAEFFRSIDRRVMQSGTPEYKIREPRTGPKGEECWLETNKIPLRGGDGTVIGLLGTYEDITERVHSEQELTRLNQELERASRLKDEFLAGMSHELRTPLNAILGISEALAEGIHGALSDTQLSYLGDVEEAGRHLLSLINDILDVAKIESGEMELEVGPMSVDSICQAGLNLVKQAAIQKKLDIESVIPRNIGIIEADERRLKQILVNLLSNAVKFTPEGGQVCLRVSLDETSQTLEFSITDTGPGIPPESLGKLFRPFIQLDSGLSRQHGGTGLGLALVYSMAELHGGGVKVESKPGHGSTFTVSIPYVVPTMGSSLEQPEAYDQPIHRALVVEDSVAAAQQLSRYLGEYSITAQICPRGDLAVDAVRQQLPDIVFLDIQLPGSNGWRVLQELKSNHETSQVPIIIVSVVDQRARGLELGANEFLVKPFTRTQLNDAILSVSSGKDSVATTQERRALVISSDDCPTSQRAHKLILAEDNPANVRTLKPYLEANGFDVSVATDGLEVIQMVDTIKPCVIVMDIQMPNMDGLEAMQRIKAMPDHSEIPIVALTALAMPGDRERCLEAGACDYLSKPVSLRNLDSSIRSALNWTTPEEVSLYS